MSWARDLRAAWSAGAAVAVLAACSSSPGPPAGTQAGTGDGAGTGAAGGTGTEARAAQPMRESPIVTYRAPAVVAIDEPALALPSQESFTLLDAGRPPRTALRYHLAAGRSNVVATTELSTRHLEGSQLTRPVALPAIRDGFAVAIAADHPGMVELLGMPGTAASPSAEADAYLASWRKLVQDRRITLAFDQRGQFSMTASGVPATGSGNDQTKDEVIQRLLSMIVPLPAEPVGAGARWRVVTILRQRPAYVKQTAIYTLSPTAVASKAGPATWKLHIKLTRVGEQQAIQDPLLPPGATADVLAVFRLLEGDIDVDPRHPLATGSLTIESRLHVELRPAGQPATEQIFEDTGTVALLRCQPSSPGCDG